jgi:hypothetical protein
VAATLLELATVGAAAALVHALLDLARRDWRADMRASSASARRPAARRRSASESPPLLGREAPRG